MNPIPIKTKTLLTLICTLVTSAGYLLAQPGSDCNCGTELKFVIEYYERNLPGFHDNVNDSNADDYNKFKTLLMLEAVDTHVETKCFKLLTHYVEYFKDNHSSIHMRLPAVDENDSTSLANFLHSEIFQQCEVINDVEVDNSSAHGIEGIYQTRDSAYTIAIVKDVTAFRHYAGVIVDSRTKLWTQGQVKLELKQVADSSFQAFVYMRNHSLVYNGRYNLQNGVLGNSWYKTSLVKNQNFSTDVGSNIEFGTISDSINYLRIPTFSGYSTAELDSAYKAIDNMVLASPYLIIDVRNNGGGSDRNVLPLLKYMYTGPVSGDEVELYVTDDNIAVFDRWLAEMSEDTVNFSRDFIDHLKSEIQRMKESPRGQFLSRGENEPIIMDTVLPYPKKIAIITNQNCASSCETLLFWARQSDKTIIAGENSGGYVGYGEVGSVKTPCFGFDLGCTMTRYKEQRKYEVDGVPPDVQLDPGRSWIDQTIGILIDKH